MRRVSPVATLEAAVVTLARADVYFGSQEMLKREREDDEEEEVDSLEEQARKMLTREREDGKEEESDSESKDSEGD